MTRSLLQLPAILLVALIVTTGCAAGGAGGQGGSEVQAFTNARIFDGTGAPVVERGTVLVRDGRVIEVGSASEVRVPDGAEIVDLGGRTLAPGLINAHGHVNGNRAAVLEQLDQYGYYGVTTVVSLGGDGPAGVLLRDEQATAGLDRPRLFVAGPVINPSSPQAARSAVADLAEMDVDWVKFRVDDFLGATSKMAPSVYRAIIGEAQDHGIPVAIHIVDLEDAKGVVEAGGSLVAHSVRDREVDQELIDLLLDQDVCLVPTFTRELSTFVYAQRPPFFDDIFFLERAAPDDLDAFLTPQRRQQSQGSGAQYWRNALPVAMENLRILHEAGVGIGMGTDTGPAGRFQGYFEHLEMEMMVDAGLSPEAVLLSATGQAARCMGLAGDVGTIEPGAWADFVAFDDDPLADIRNTRSLSGVWIAGNTLR